MTDNDEFERIIKDAKEADELIGHGAGAWIIWGYIQRHVYTDSDD